MCGKMQESHLTEVIPLMCTAAIWDRYSVFSTSSVSSGCTFGGSYSLMAARCLAFLPELPQGSQLRVVAIADDWHSLFTDMAGSILFLTVWFPLTISSSGIQGEGSSFFILSDLCLLHCFFLPFLCTPGAFLMGRHVTGDIAMSRATVPTSSSLQLSLHLLPVA